MSNIISWFFDVRLLMNVVRLFIIFLPNVSWFLSELFNHVLLLCCGCEYSCFLILLAWYACVYNGNAMIFYPPIVIYDQRPMNSLSSPEVVIRGIISVVTIVTVYPGLYIISHGVDVSDVMSFILGQNWFNILVVYIYYFAFSNSY